MKKMRIAVAATLIAAGLVTLALGQVGGTTGGTPSTNGQAHHAPRLVVEREILGKLSLTEAQKGQIKDVVTKLMAEVKEARQQAKGSTDKTALHAKTKELWASYEKSLHAILTPAQQVQYKQLHKEYKAKEAAGAAASAGTGSGH
jgi:Spy/CpxP family protein refolding chaperone